MIEKYLAQVKDGTPSSGRLAYRGQKNKEWPLHSGTTRKLVAQGMSSGDDHFVTDYVSYHKDIVNRSHNLGLDVENGRVLTHLELLAKLQHFGAATGLLDFTWSLPVALWFATEDEECDGKLFVYNTNVVTTTEQANIDVHGNDLNALFHPIEQPDQKVLYFERVADGDALRRVLVQQSVFIIDRPSVDWRNMREIDIFKDDKSALREELELFGINQRSLFPDLLGFCQMESIELNTPNVPTTKENFRLAIESYQKRDYDSSIAFLNRCIKSEPTNSELYFLRGNARAELLDHRGSIDDYDQAIKHHRLQAENRNLDHATSGIMVLKRLAYFNRANAKSELKDYDGAIADYRECLRQDANFAPAPPAYLNLGNIHAKQHRFEEALGCYENAYRLGNFTSLFNMGNTLVMLQQFERARDCFSEYCKKTNRTEVTSERSNLPSVERLINLTGGGIISRNLIYSEAMVLELIVSGAGTRTEIIPFTGNIGNTGNFGGSGLHGGDGYEGSDGFVVKINFATNRSEPDS